METELFKLKAENAELKTRILQGTNQGIHWAQVGFK